MRPIATLFALFAVVATAQAATPLDPSAPDARTATAATVATSAPSKTKCIREKEIGSNRIKRVCLPEDQLRQLTPEQRIDLIRSDRPPADAIAD